LQLGQTSATPKLAAVVSPGIKIEWVTHVMHDNLPSLTIHTSVTKSMSWKNMVDDRIENNEAYQYVTYSTTYLIVPSE